MLFQQNSLSIREESSAEDLTQQGREANLRSEPSPPKKKSRKNLQNQKKRQFFFGINL